MGRSKAEPTAAATRRPSSCSRSPCSIGSVQEATASRGDRARGALSAGCQRNLPDNEHGVLRGVLVGCGYIAPSHMKAWSRLPVAIEAVCDPNVARARAFAAHHGVPAAFASLGEALRAVEPDFVDVAAGPEAHPDLVEEAVAAGCHVLCQKPLANDLPGAERIVAAAARGRVVAVNEMWKHLPGYAIAREFLATGAAGEIRGARVRQVANLMLTQEDGSPPRRLQPGGQVAFATIPRVLLFDFGVHLVDLVRALFGPAS